mmetsp:Transcript_1634/g.1596  ORF Transcript_1634/g.1596 Transcript_1634/m.1596 type:complete len:215 (+) Transcript_1634:892-1536(+)
MSLLQQKLPASQFENEKVEEEPEEDNYEDDFERIPSSGEKKKGHPESIGSGAMAKPPKADKTERPRRRPKGLPPTAPSHRVIPPMPQSNRDREVGELNISKSKASSRHSHNRKSSKSKRVIEESLKKNRRNPKTTEAQLPQPVKAPPTNLYDKRYRMYSKDGMGPKKVSEIYRMRAKEVENQEKRMNKELRNKYQDRVYVNNKYLSRDYASKKS